MGLRKIDWRVGLLTVAGAALACGSASKSSDPTGDTSGGGGTTATQPTGTGTSSSPTDTPVPTTQPTSTSPIPTGTSTASSPPTGTVPPLPPPVAQKCDAPAVVCEDFETGAVNTAVWTIRNPNATLEVVQDRVAHGKYAMHTRTLADAGSSAQLVENTFLGGNFYGRVYMYFDIRPQNIHAFVFEGLGNDQGHATEMSVSIGKTIYLGYMRDNPLVELSSPSAGRQMVQPGKWFCLEWNLRPVEGQHNAMWVDGVPASTDDGLVFQVPPFTEARIGWTHFAHDDPNPFTDIWYDDIAFGPERIGCK